MLTKEEKQFFFDTAKRARKLSNCNESNGAILIQGKRILAHGYNRRIIKDKDWEISAIYDAIFGARDIDISGSTIFSSYFPTIDDMKLILVTGISTVYFSGEISNNSTIELINCLPEAGISLELIQLKSV